MVPFASSKEDLVDKIQSALQSSSFRETIREKGYERCMREPYDYSSAVQKILHRFELAANHPIPGSGITTENRAEKQNWTASESKVAKA